MTPAPPVVALAGSELTLIAVIVLLVVVSIFLAIAETALTRVSKAKALALADKHDRSGEALLTLAQDPEMWINPLLLIVLSAQLVQASLVGILFDHLFGSIGAAVAVAVNVVIVFIVAESLPKTWAMTHAEQAAIISAPTVLRLVRFPPVRAASGVLTRLSRRLLPDRQGPNVSEEELLALADEALEEDVIEHGERALIESIIEFGDTIVREVMVPRPDMVTVPSEFRVADVLEIVLLNGYSRMPVLGEGIDDVSGLIYAKDLMRAERDGFEDQPVSGLLRPARLVPESKRVPELLREMQQEQFHMAIVIDEYGGTAGLVTLEDLIEELVGEIVDEFDHEEAMVEPLAGGGIRVNARMSMDEVNDLLPSALPEGDWDSVGGLLYHELGRPPIEGEEIRTGHWVLRAERVQGRRIGRVRIMPTLPIVPPTVPTPEAPSSRQLAREEGARRDGRVAAPDDEADAEGAGGAADAAGAGDAEAAPLGTGRGSWPSWDDRTWASPRSSTPSSAPR
jgi:putative hemolysin